MLKICLVEDDITYRKKFTDYLNRYESENHEKILISVFTNGKDAVDNYTAEYDILFMDIEMPYMDGMTAAANIRKIDKEVIIIFITNMPQFAIKGYTVDALDYVLKPITYFSFMQRINRALLKMKNRKVNFIILTNKTGIDKIEESKITYIEVFNHDLVYHTTNQNYSSKGSISKIEKNIKSKAFFRCNKCYLVNLEYIKSIHGYDVTVNTDIIRVSRDKKKLLLDALNNYLNECK